jgi:hypothetical protein
MIKLMTPKERMADPTPDSVVGVSTVGRRFGQVAARAALQPPLSRISEGSNESGSAPAAAAPSNATSPPADKVRELLTATMNNKFAVAGLVFVLTALLLCVLNPPMAQNPSVDNPAAPPSRSPQKILMWSSLAAVVTLALPYGSCLVKKGE